jgi:hypothetical protein
VAKSQKRSNREAKKPKQDKPKSETGPSQVKGVFDRSSPSPKKK